MSDLICTLCEEQTKRSRNGKPHADLVKVDALRVFEGTKPRGYAEQDYQCQACKAKFTHSTAKNDLPWTLWRG